MEYLNQSPLLGVDNISTPAFLMNIPFSLDFGHPNNATMKELDEDERVLNLDLALRQFHSLYSFVSQNAYIFLLPSVQNLQDQTYVSNVGSLLPHLQQNTIALSNFRSEPRMGEEIIAASFLKMMGFDVVQAPEFFEGEADLKHLKENIYVGAYGMRTSKTSLDWLSKKFDMEIIRVKITDPHAYHLDCLLFPLDRQNTLVCTRLLDETEISNIEKHTSIIDITYGEAMAMATNCVRIGNSLAVQSNISLYKKEEEMFAFEKAKIKKLDWIADNFGLTVQYFDLTEFRKSGAALSCFFMRLNSVASNM